MLIIDAARFWLQITIFRSVTWVIFENMKNYDFHNSKKTKKIQMRLFRKIFHENFSLIFQSICMTVKYRSRIRAQAKLT